MPPAHSLGQKQVVRHPAREGAHRSVWLSGGRRGVLGSGQGPVIQLEDLHPSPGSEGHLCGSQLPKVQNEKTWSSVQTWAWVPKPGPLGWHVVPSLSSVRPLGRTENSWYFSLRASERNVTVPSRLWAHYSQVHYCLI